MLLMSVADFWLGAFASFISSFVFIFFLLICMRPQIKISGEIAKHKDIYTGQDRSCYVFKIVNKSWFSAYDVTAELNSLISFRVEGGNNYRYKNLPLKTSRVNFVGPFFWKAWFSKEHTEFAILFICYEDIPLILDDMSNFIQFQVTLRHGVTGLSKVFNVDFVSNSVIKDGHFGCGNNFKIS